MRSWRRASGPEVLTASAASPVVAQLLTHAAAAGGGSAQAAAAVPVEDVKAASSSGSALGSSVLPLVLAGIVTGLMGVSLASGALRRTGLIVAGSVLAGLAAMAVVQGWLDVVEGDWAANAAALGLTVLAIAAVVAGLDGPARQGGCGGGRFDHGADRQPVLRRRIRPELLPQPVGGIGQLLPPGAGGNLLRSTGFFDGAAAGEHALVLAIWAAAGLLALAVAAARGTRLGTAPAGSPA